MIADANASVVSPLTTIVAKIMDTGVSKETAIVMTAQALGIDTSIDLTTYDPILETALGNDEQAGAVLVANLRMANLINQSEGLLLAIAEEYEGMSIGDQLLDQIAGAILSEPGAQLDMDKVLTTAIPAAIQSVDHAQELDDLDEMIMLALITEVDQLYIDSLTDSTPDTIMEDQDEILQQSIVLRNAAIVGDIELQEFSLIVLSSEGGSVQGGGVFEYGTNAPLHASPDDNYTFDGWSGDGVLEPDALSTSVYITNDQTITGVFSLNQYELTANADTGGTVSGAGTYGHGSVATLIATADEGYSFAGWTIDGAELVGGPEIELEMTGAKMPPLPLPSINMIGD